jgi:hypothetical protein
MDIYVLGRHLCTVVAAYVAGDSDGAKVEGEEGVGREDGRVENWWCLRFGFMQYTHVL